MSARWSVSEIQAHGRVASINASLATNLTDIRVNNSIESETLAGFATDTNGVLVLRFEYDQDVAAALRGTSPLYAPVSGVVYAERCLR